MTPFTGSDWVTQPRSIRDDSCGEADSSLVEIQVLLRLRGSLALEGRPGRARLSNSGH